MRILAILGHAFALIALFADTATGSQIHCGGANCAKLRIRCSGPAPCYVGFLGEDDGYHVSVARRHDGQYHTTESIFLDRLVDVSVRTGSGDDGVGFTNALVDGDLRISMGRGDDQVFFRTPIYGSVLVVTGAGDDTVTMGFFPPLASDDHKLFDGGTGNDALYLTVAPPLRPATVERFESVQPY